MRAPFDANQGLIILGAKLWGPTGSVVLRVALDTGATSTIVNVGILVAVGYDLLRSSDDAGSRSSDDGERR